MPKQGTKRTISTNDNAPIDRPLIKFVSLLLVVEYTHERPRKPFPFITSDVILNIVPALTGSDFLWTRGKYLLLAF